VAATAAALGHAPAGPVAGVGQRMITGVAKRMAGQFFKAIDDELTGVAVPVDWRTKRSRNCSNII
jgi:hypothetical protein